MCAQAGKVKYVEEDTMDEGDLNVALTPAEPSERRAYTQAATRPTLVGSVVADPGIGTVGASPKDDPITPPPWTNVARRRDAICTMMFLPNSGQDEDLSD